jgi:hypothetical protein
MASITLDDATILTHRTNQAPDGSFGKDTSSVDVACGAPVLVNDTRPVENQVNGDLPGAMFVTG